MRHRRLLFYLIFCAALLPAPPAGADGAILLTRAEAVASAASHHPRMEAAASRQDAAAQQIRQARSGFMPHLSVSERFASTNNPMWAFGTRLNQERITMLDFDPDRLNDPDPIENFTTTVSVRWPLYDSGQTLHGLRQARQGAAAVDQRARQSLQSAMADAARAYDGWLLAQKRLETIDQALALTQAHEKMIDERYRAGFVVKSDLLRARLRRSELEQQRLTAQSAIAIAIARLNAAMGLDPSATWTPADGLTATEEPPGTLADWEAKAQDHRPELAELGHHQAAAQSEIDKHRAARLPGLSLFGDYEIHTEAFDDTGNNYTVGAMIQWDLFTGGRQTARTEAARAALRELEARRRELAAGIVVQTREAFLSAESAWHRIPLAAAGVTQADETLRIVADRYRNGLVTVVDLLEAQSTAEKARFDHLQAIYDYRLARVQLLLATGVLDAEALAAP
ncbi:MAG: TolC family protein [Desulfobacteraceae bacterium]|nr:TolC family protein [Desulfobacteraceae bacterium]